MADITFGYYEVTWYKPGYWWLLGGWWLLGWLLGVTRLLDRITIAYIYVYIYHVKIYLTNHKIVGHISANSIHQYGIITIIRREEIRISSNVGIDRIAGDIDTII